MVREEQDERSVLRDCSVVGWSRGFSRMSCQWSWGEERIQ